MVRRACIEPGCPGYGEDSTRCPAHARAAGRAKRVRRSTPGGGAARRLRYRVRQSWAVGCHRCGAVVGPGSIEVDHIVALADGGLDIEQNLQLLCRACHVEKTTAENQRRARRQ